MNLKPVLVAVLAAMVADPAAAENFYFRNVTPGSGGASAPSAGTNNPGTGQETPKSLSITAAQVPVQPSVGGSVSVPFSASNASGTPAFTYTGNLPTGLDLSTAGLLSGNLLRAGTYAFTVIVSDATGAKAQSAQSMDVLPSPPAVAVASTPGKRLVAGTPYTGSSRVTNDGSVVQWNLGTGPSAWLRVASSTGDVTGTPPVGTTNFDYQVIGTDPFGRTGTGGTNVTLEQPTATQTLASARPGETVSGSVQTNLPSPAFASADKPSWVTLDTTVGTLAGTVPDAASGSYPFSVTATGGGISRSASLNLVVNAHTAQATVDAVARSGRTYAGTASTSLSSPTWALIGATPASPAMPQPTVTGTTLSGTAPVVTATTGYAFALKATKGTTTATTAQLALSVVQPLSATMADVTPTAGAALASIGPTVGGKIGSLTYQLTANGTTGNTALSACGISFDQVNGKLYSNAVSACGPFSTSIAVTDDGNGQANLADAKTATFNVSVTAANTDITTIRPSAAYRNNTSGICNVSVSTAGCTILPMPTLHTNTTNNLYASLGNGDALEMYYAAPVAVGSLTFRFTDNKNSNVGLLQYWGGTAWVDAPTPAYWNGGATPSLATANSTIGDGKTYAQRWRYRFTNANSGATIDFAQFRFGNASQVYAP